MHKQTCPTGGTSVGPVVFRDPMGAFASPDLSVITKSAYIGWLRDRQAPRAGYPFFGDRLARVLMSCKELVFGHDHAKPAIVLPA